MKFVFKWRYLCLGYYFGRAIDLSPPPPINTAVLLPISATTYLVCSHCVGYPSSTNTSGPIYSVTTPRTEPCRMSYRSPGFSDALGHISPMTQTVPSQGSSACVRALVVQFSFRDSKDHRGVTLCYGLATDLVPGANMTTCVHTLEEVLPRSSNI
jgi:hypothetical protein